LKLQGSLTVKVEPPPGVPFAEIVPPCRSTIFWQIAGPSGPQIRTPDQPVEGLEQPGRHIDPDTVIIDDQLYIVILQALAVNFHKVGYRVIEFQCHDRFSMSAAMKWIGPDSNSSPGHSTRLLQPNIKSEKHLRNQPVQVHFFKGLSRLVPGELKAI
jgi:hypothetical protein